MFPAQFGDKQAFHLIQSFAPGEIDFDTAHQVGIELADKLFYLISFCLHLADKMS